MNPLRELDEYPALGTPYAFPSCPPATFDCWTLVEHLRGQMGLLTPPVAAGWTPETFPAAVEAEQGAWRRVEEGEGIQPGDVVLFNARHVGVLVDRDTVAHATPESGVVYSPLRAIRRRFPGWGCYRPWM